MIRRGISALRRSCGVPAPQGCRENTRIAFEALSNFCFRAFLGAVVLFSLASIVGSAMKHHGATHEAIALVVVPAVGVWLLLWVAASEVRDVLLEPGIETATIDQMAERTRGVSISLALTLFAMCLWGLWGLYHYGSNGYPLIIPVWVLSLVGTPEREIQKAIEDFKTKDKEP